MESNNNNDYNKNKNRNSNPENNNSIKNNLNYKKNAENFIQSPIQNFYAGGSVLITGSTGFVGKALVEKLLRSCPGIINIFLLIRPKRGLSVDVRFRELMKGPVSK